MAALKDTRAHIARVRALMREAIQNLTARAKAHDQSKLVEPERSGFVALQNDLRSVAYGSDDYRAALQEAKEIINHHYKENDHHPEHWPNGISDMSLLSLIELLADWCAASERTEGGSLAQSLAINAQRFGISRDLMAILENTRRELDW